MSWKAGYTLVEVLAAITVIGITLGGLSNGARVLNRLQHRQAEGLGEVTVWREIQHDLDQFSSNVGGNGFVQGDAGKIVFACDATPCEARIASGRLEIVSGGEVRLFDLPRKDLRFSFHTNLRTTERWPSSDTFERVRGISVGGEGSGQPLAYLRVRSIEQPGCQFDLVALVCRGAAS